MGRWCPDCDAEGLNPRSGGDIRPLAVAESRVRAIVDWEIRAVSRKIRALGKMADIAKKSRAGIFLAGGAVAVVLVTAGSWPNRVLPSEETPVMDVKPRPIAMIRPGTVVGDRAPKGWTHLVIKSYPHISQESLPKVSATTARMASMLFTVMLAKVEGERKAGGFPRFHLAKVAVGVGTTVNGQEMVLTKATEAQLGADLGFIDRRVLAGGEDQLKKMSAVARSPSMAILDTPSFMFRKQKHIRVVIRYALLLDPATGRLTVLAWALEEDRKAGAAPLGPIELLPENLVHRCPLHVDTNEYVLGFPTKRSFAMYTPPPGRKKIDPPEQTRRLAAAVPPFQPAQAEALQKQLRGLVAAQRDP